jgi:hypothetical protein
MAKNLTMNVQIEGVQEALKSFRDLPKDTSNEMRDRAKKLAEALAGRVQSAARADDSPQAALMAGTVKARRDRVPVIAAGGARKVGRRKASAWALLFGAEFGSNRYPQFGKSHSGRKGSWLFGVADDNADMISREWNAAADAVIAKWSDGGGM